MRGIHEELIVLPNIGHGFITGVPDKCDHNTDLTVFELGNGDVIFERDILCPTNEATQEYLQHIAQQRNTFVSGGTSACSKCRKIMSLKDLMGDAYWL